MENRILCQRSIPQFLKQENLDEIFIFIFYSRRKFKGMIIMYLQLLIKFCQKLCSVDFQKYFV
jgi:hypothetical protein